MNTVSKVAEWLSTLPHVADVHPVSVTIKGKVYHGARYKQTVPIAPGCPAYARGERAHIAEHMYLLGELPAHYRRSTKACYAIEGDDREWYVSSYFQDDVMVHGSKFKLHHPFGNTFMLSPWAVPDGGKIDQYEPRPYARVPLTIHE
jgi:hypothetical protein